MQIKKSAAKFNHYHMRDAQEAIKLIADSYDVPIKKMASLCGVSDTTFSQRLHGVVKASHVNDFSIHVLKQTPSVHTKQVQMFDERYVAKLTKYLGEECVYPGKGFASIEAMISYAQENCKAQLAARQIAEAVEMNNREIAKLHLGKECIGETAKELGKRCGHANGFPSVGDMIRYAQQQDYPSPWIRTDYQGQEAAEEQARFKEHLDEYRLAAKLLVEMLEQERDVTWHTLHEGISDHARLRAYLSFKQVNFGQMAEDAKVENLKLLAENIGRALDPKAKDPMVLDDMLGLAQMLFPDQFIKMKAAAPKKPFQHDHGGGHYV